MENRKIQIGSTSKSSSQNSNFRRDGEKSFEPKRFQSRDNRFEPRRDGFQNRDEKFQAGNDKIQNREGKFQPRDSKLQPPVNKDQPKRRFVPKDKNYKSQERESPLLGIVSEKQITDGKHRGKYLQNTASPKARLTARCIREVMFRILYRRVRAGRFLDLCAGSGMVGIEAVSRGALLSTFVERSAKMCSFIKRNLETCAIKQGHGEVVEAEVVPFLKQMEKRRRCWDVVYFDPPYDANYDEVLAFFGRGAAIIQHGVLIIEHHAEMFFPENFGVMKCWRVLIQGETALSFYERK